MNDKLLNHTEERQVRRGARQVVYAPAADEAPKQQFQWRVYMKRVGIALVAVAMLWVVFFSGWLNVRSISLQGKHSLTRETVADDVQAYLSRFPTQRNLLFLQTDELAAYIQQQHPTLQKVNINRTLTMGISVGITESQPALIWQTGSKSWLVGEDGRVLRVAEEGDASFGRVIDTAQLDVEAGNKVVDADFVGFTRSVYAIAQEKGVAIEQVSIGDTTRELLVAVQGGVVIKMAVERGAGEQLEAYLKTLETAKKEGKPVREYVDVRVVG
ncbi:MAG: cell division protein FtsQ, partial [Patescibacteria group bacterium]|nr:cell division protein FtsQ [Patescibacteria group bacterium]